LLFSVATLILSCSSGETNNIVGESVVENLNTLANRQLITDLFTKGTSVNKKLEELSKNSKFSKNSGVEMNIEELLTEYQECSSCSTEYKNFLIPFFREVIDLNFESDIISKIEEYELSLEQSNLNDISKDNLRFILFSFKEAATYVVENPNTVKTTLGKVSEVGCGRALSEGLVGGFVAGCVQGGIAGAGGGTVVLPVIGTVTGAVAGCVGGGAVGAVVSGFTSWLWCAVK